ncbi:butyrate kinase [candidate division WOR-3 bacterium JGI_Cruoil_03_44_89]|uniref:Probable butyrate kinase n=1 Tax=candidate division WOR-3 bacterium JGI_Cruoil_03_44_89 TaxID=1973748 RepID=A0A235BX04_UNCW3|nr:MAG: butyrate kinase [candidate division WOR-3 bacterium JGI_Cruoil_03_44_89]
MYKILVINPGSTSTKSALFDDESSVFNINISHSPPELAKFPEIIDQFTWRCEVIKSMLNERGITLNSIDAVVGRGGLLNAIPGGTYSVNEKMMSDLRRGVQGEHASNLGGLMAYEFASSLEIPAFIVDPVVVDELDEVARISGIPDIKRRSIFHALNQKQVARLAARELKKSYDEINLIVVHMGGGISVGVHKKGKVVDVNNALNGEGPFTPERSGSLPVWDLVKLVLSGKYTRDELKKKITGKGGLVAYLGTNDLREVREKMNRGNEKAKLLYEAMAYQISKEIGACATVLRGDIQGIVLSGGLAHDNAFIELIRRSVNFIAKIFVFPGGDEMKALAMGALRVLRGEERAKVYK